MHVYRPFAKNLKGKTINPIYTKEIFSCKQSYFAKERLTNHKRNKNEKIIMSARLKIFVRLVLPIEQTFHHPCHTKV